MNEKDKAFLQGTANFRSVGLNLRLLRYNEKDTIHQAEVKQFIADLFDLLESNDFLAVGSVVGDDYELWKGFLPAREGDNG